MKKKLYLFVFIVLGCSLFADWSASVTESYFTLADSLGIVDTTGGVGDNTATIYAAFRIAPEVGFKVTGPDVWAVYDMALGEDVTQEDPIVIVNDAAALIDLGFSIGSEDIVSAPDAAPWSSRDTWTPTSTPNEYTLGLIICDDDLTVGPGASEYETDDILIPLPPDSTEWYLVSGQFRPFSSALAYEHEGSISLSLFSASGMNTVHAFFRLLVSEGGSTDDYPHAVQVIITARLSAG